MVLKFETKLCAAVEGVRDFPYLRLGAKEYFSCI
jgi:hypothetical protein